MKIPFSQPKHLPKDPPPNTISYGGQDLTYEFWGGNIQTIAPIFFIFIERCATDKKRGPQLLALVTILLPSDENSHSRKLTMSSDGENLEGFQQERLQEDFEGRNISWKS